MYAAPPVDPRPLLPEAPLAPAVMLPEGVGVMVAMDVTSPTLFVWVMRVAVPMLPEPAVPVPATPSPVAFPAG